MPIPREVAFCSADVSDGAAFEFRFLFPQEGGVFVERPFLVAIFVLVLSDLVRMHPNGSV